MLYATLVLLIPMILTGIGTLLNIYLTGGQVAFKLLIISLVAIGAVIAILFIPRKIVLSPRFAIVFHILNILLLLGTFLLGPTVANTKRWLYFGSFTFQPTEMFKVSFILMAAHILASPFFDFKNKKSVFLTLALLLAPLLIIFLQPDAGNFILLFIILLSMLLSYAIEHKYININHVFALSVLVIIYIASIFIRPAIILVLPAAFLLRQHLFSKESIVSTLVIHLLLVSFVLFLVFYKKLPILHEYQKQRIETFTAILDPSKNLIERIQEQEENNFNLQQARIAIGSAGLTGKGLNQATQSKLKFLPEFRTDFTYAAFTEAFGLTGSIVLLTLYMTLLFVILLYPEPNRFVFYLKIGIFTLLFGEIVVAIGSNLGLLPTKGLPLPFIGYGGTYLIAHYMLLAILIKAGGGNRTHNLPLTKGAL